MVWLRAHGTSCWLVLESRPSAGQLLELRKLTCEISAIGDRVREVGFCYLTRLLPRTDFSEFTTAFLNTERLCASNPEALALFMTERYQWINS
jgi:hypothetical protein